MGVKQGDPFEMRRSKLRSVILTTIAVAGVITISMMAPHVLSVLGRVQRRWSEQNIQSAVYRLEKHGLVKVEDGSARLTPRGVQYLQMLELQVRRPKRWDKKWRVVVFDIPEHHKRLRDRLRSSLESIGFVRLQHSVWVYPYECKELIALLTAEYHIGKDVLYLTADKIEHDRAIRSYFGVR